MESVALDCAGRRRSPATFASFHEDRAPRNKGIRYPADPPTVPEIIAVMRAAGARPDGNRLQLAKQRTAGDKNHVAAERCPGCRRAGQVT